MSLLFRCVVWDISIWCVGLALHFVDSVLLDLYLMGQTLCKLQKVGLCLISILFVIQVCCQSLTGVRLVLFSSFFLHPAYPLWLINSSIVPSSLQAFQHVCKVSHETTQIFVGVCNKLSTAVDQLDIEVDLRELCVSTYIPTTPAERRVKPKEPVDFTKHMAVGDFSWSSLLFRN